MSKWIPSGNKIMVRMQPVMTVSPGGIQLPEETTRKERYAQTEGVLVAMGPMAYNDQRMITLEGDRVACPWAKVGDTVRISKGIGYLHDEDGHQYRIVSDLDLIMVLVEEGE